MAKTVWLVTGCVSNNHFKFDENTFRLAFSALQVSSARILLIIFFFAVKNLTKAEKSVAANVVA